MKKEKPFVTRLKKGNNKYQSVLQGKPQTQGMRAGRVFLLPGKDCGQHSTNSNEEFLVFLTGKGEVITEKNAPLQVDKGKVCYIPPETIHNVKNIGNEPLIYVYCVAPTNQKKSEF